MPTKSMYARVSRAVKRGIKKRYYNKRKGAVRFGQIARDVASLKKAINSEKKHHLQIPASGTFAQFNSIAASTSGHLFQEISPNVVQGVGSNQRVGNQFKLTGACMEFQLEKLPNMHGTCSYKIMIIQQQNGNDALDIADLLEGNHFITTGTIYDTHSQRNQMQMSNMKVIKTIYGRFNQDQNDDTGSANTQAVIRNHTCPLKLNALVKYNSGGSNTPIVNRFYVLYLAGTGELIDSESIKASAYIRYYYVDN